jgi:predicted GIY-YIG superfamily endonuclease
MKEKRKYLYVLLLEDDHYYIGQTNDLTRRFRQHCEQKGEGSVWTFYYKPIRIVEYWDLGEYTQEGAMQFETQLTIEYMNKFGIDNVRGGEYIFSDADHHYGLVSTKNYLVEGKIIPKASEEAKIAYSAVKKIIERLDETKSYIYVLELLDSCVYINTSNKIDKDIRRHFLGKGSLWSDIHRPIGLIEIMEDKDLGKFNPIPFQNSIVRKYMKIYGWSKVRGGDYKVIDEKLHYQSVMKKMPDVIK